MQSRVVYFSSEYLDRKSTIEERKFGNLSLKLRLNVVDQEKSQPRRKYYRSLNAISRLSRKFNWFQNSILDELR